MSASFDHERLKPLLLVPGGYFYVSRLRSIRDLAINTIQWIAPGLILSVLLSGSNVWLAIGYFVLGLILFVCVYELGYIANDSYGLRNDPTPRARVKIRFSAAFLAIFVVIRVATFLLLAIHLDIVTVPSFIGWYLALVAALVLHNTMDKVQFKFFSFLQLSLLRFSLPVLPALLAGKQAAEFAVVVVTGLLLFTFPRVLTYFDAKGRMDIEERKETRFLLIAHGVTTPMIAALSLQSGTIAPLCAWAWLIFAQLIYLQVSRVHSLR